MEKIKSKILEMAIKILEVAKTDKTEDVNIQYGTYEGGNKYISITIEYEPDKVICADDKEVE